MKKFPVSAVAFVAVCALCHAQETNTANKTVSPVIAPAKMPAPALVLTPAQKERYHSVHYSFGHKLIPEFVYKSTVDFRDTFAGASNGFKAEFAAALTNIWNAAWQTKDAPVPVGLKSEFVELPVLKDAPNVKGFLITFPEPPQTPDNHFAFIFIDRQKDLRYLTYEKSVALGASAEGGAVLCGWNPDGSRANYMVFGGSSRAAFSKVLIQFLKSSEKGAEIKPSASWNPEKETYPKAKDE